MSTSSGKKRLADEIVQLEALLEEDPESPDFYRLADVYSRVGRFMDAIKIAMDGLKHHPRLLKGHVALGRSLFGAGKLNGATKVLRKALSFREDDSEPYRLLGEVLIRRKIPVEAVSVLEEAVSRGYDDRAIQKLLERARQAMDAEQTNVVGVPDMPRGIGNVAVAGVIGMTGEVSIPPPEAVSGQIEKSDEDDKTRPHLKLPAAGRPEEQQQPPPPAPKKASDAWSSIDDGWEQELDAQSDGSFPDLGSDVGGPFDRRPRVDISLAPLMDPLAEGMPPLPPETEESDVIDVTSAPQVTAPVDRSEARTVVEPVKNIAPPVRLPSSMLQVTGDLPRSNDSLSTLPLEISRGGLDLNDEVAPDEERIAFDKTMPQIPRSPTRSPPAGDRAPPRDDAMTIEAIAPAAAAPEIEDEIEPEVEAEEDFSFDDPFEPAADEELEAEAPDLPPLDEAFIDGDPPADFDGPGIEDLGIPGLVGQEAEAGDPLSFYEERAHEDEWLEPGAQPPRSRRRGTLWVIIIFCLFAASGVSGVFGWRWYTSKQDRVEILKVTALARLTGTLEAYEKATARLSRSRDQVATSPVLAAEAELMHALAWHQYGVGKPPVVTPSHTPWAHVGARVAVKLASHQPDQAITLLQKEPRDANDVGLASFLKAWAVWLLGDSGSALTHLGVINDPSFANGHLLTGHIRREAGELQEAEDAYRKALDQSPNHQLASLGLAAVLMEKRSSSVEIDQLLEIRTKGPVARAWLGILAGEDLLHRGKLAAGVKKIQSALSVAPSRAALLLQGARALLKAGKLAAALAVLKRLQSVRAAKDVQMDILAAELELCRGLPEQAILKLKHRKLPPRGHQINAGALLQMGQVAAGQKALRQAPENQRTRILSLAARSILNEEKALAQLVKLAATSPLARLWLARLMARRGMTKEAIAEARKLSAQALFRHQSLTLQARIMLKTGDLGGAFTALTEVVRSNPRYLPAREILGHIYLRLGRNREAAQAFGVVETAGRLSVELLLAHAEALALAGSHAEAKAKLEQARKLGGVPPGRSKIIDGLIHLTLGQHQQATRLLARVADSDMNALIGLGRAHYELKNYPAARKCFSRAMTNDPAHPAPYLWLGTVALAAREPNAAAHFRLAIQRSRKRRYFPRSIVGEAHVGIALCFQLKRARPPLVLKELRKALEIDPANARAYRIQGEVFLKQRKLRRAKAALMRSATLDPRDATTFFLIGFSSKNKRSAREALRRFLELEPAGKRAGRASARLRKLR